MLNQALERMIRQDEAPETSARRVGLGGLDNELVAPCVRAVVERDAAWGLSSCPSLSLVRGEADGASAVVGGAV
jgi:hypothetical protein